MKRILKNNISALSDDILILVLSYLKLSEAVQTSVLSHRWRYLWTYVNGVFDFVKPFVRYNPLLSQEEQNIKCRFIEWVNLVLSMHKGSTIHEFRVCFNLDEGSSEAVSSWIKFALERHVKRLVLDFGSSDFLTPAGNYVLRTPLISSCRASLTALYLTRVEFTQEVLGHVLYHHPLLQLLQVKSSLSLVELKIAAPVPNLRCLEIMDCPSMRHLEVYAINLVSFTYTGPEISIFFKEYPCLVKANLRGDVFLHNNIHQYSSSFSRLKSLTLDLRAWTYLESLMRGDLPKLPKFPKLEYLEMSLSGNINLDYLRRCTKLMKASPLLQRFVLKIYQLRGNVICSAHGERRMIKHKHVKAVEFVGFLGQKQDVALVRHILDMLPSVEKVFVDPRPICPRRNLRDWELREAITAAQQLQNSLPPLAELELTFRHSNCFTEECFYKYY